MSMCGSDPGAQRERTVEEVKALREAYRAALFLYTSKAMSEIDQLTNAAYPMPMIERPRNVISRAVVALGAIAESLWSSWRRI